MAKHHHPIIALILAAFLVAACASAPSPTPSPAPMPATVPPTPTALPAAPANPPPTVTPTTIPPAPTALPATATNPPPTTTLPPPEKAETEPEQDDANVTEANRMNILFAPIINTFLKEHLFADIFARDVLDFQSRELVTISALSSMTGTGGQLYFHLGAAMNTGLSKAQMQDFIAVLASRVDTKIAENANEILRQVLSSRAPSGAE